MSSQQNSTNSTSNPPPSFDDISKYFCLPLSDAVGNLGVCTTVLKKICCDNGLDRWPYRKFLAGKSIEEIKKYAARERNKKLAVLSKVGRQSGSQPQNNEMSKSQGVTSPHNLQQQGTKIITMGKPHIWLNTSLTKGMTTLDEFKYGFPSDGLSTATNKWWGSSSLDMGIHEDGAETDGEDKHQSEEKADGAHSMIVDNEKPEDGEMLSIIGFQGSGSLTAIRKRTMEEGREALKLGVYRTHGLKKLGRREKALLFQIFKSLLPKEWICSAS